MLNLTGKIGKVNDSELKQKD